MNAMWMIGAASLALAACGGSDDAPNEETPAERADSLQPGQYEIGYEVTEVRTTDQSEPRTDLAVGSAETRSVCVGEDGRLPAAAFAEGSDECGIESPYFRRGQIRQTLRCSRGGEMVMLNANGNFTGESAEGVIETETFFAAAGDYALKRTFTANRTGDCSAEGTADTDTAVG